MKDRKFLVSIILFMLLFALAGCGVSLDEQVSQAKKQVEAAFNGKPLTPNKKAKHFSYHLPKGFEVQEDVKSNVILEKGRQTYILFVNPEEDSSSKMLFNTLEADSKKLILKSSFQGKNRFGYVAVKKIDDDMYVTSVGIGGVKMTTETKASGIAKSAEEMMKIVTSVQYEK